jgi:hypothetical protein
VDHDRRENAFGTASAYSGRKTKKGIVPLRQILLRDQKRETMKRIQGYYRKGKAGWILLWLLGVPIPVLLLLFLLRGCT